MFLITTQIIVIVYPRIVCLDFLVESQQLPIFVLPFFPNTSQTYKSFRSKWNTMVYKTDLNVYRFIKDVQKDTYKQLQ